MKYSQTHTHTHTHICQSDEDLYNAFMFTEATNNNNYGYESTFSSTMHEINAGIQKSQNFKHSIEDFISNNINT